MSVNRASPSQTETSRLPQSSGGVSHCGSHLAAAIVASRREVEAVRVHDLRPSGDEVVDEFALIGHSETRRIAEFFAHPTRARARERFRALLDTESGNDAP
uniref:Uncharacterized protein n=1 Tax=mine drainage metagenome TaxID=410659 RepID=E6Q163_9ZZZZ